MSENQTTRRKFLQYLGLSAGTALISSTAFANFTNKEDILKLNPNQQEFMSRYGQWMDEFIEVIRVQKIDRGDVQNHAKMIALTERAEAFNPELKEFMKDDKFALIYKESIKRMSSEI